MSTDAWRELSPHLDHALSLEGEAREAWLREFDVRSPGLSPRLREMLAERDRIEAEGFLCGDAAVTLRAQSLAGQRLGAYVLESPLGHGGMGTVWLARRADGRFEGRAAVKLLYSALVGRPSEQRFVREGNVLAGLQHPHIAHLIDAGLAPGGQPYLVLEHVEGLRIDEYCERQALGIEARIRIFLDVLAAVGHAHTHLVVHRDLKPSNIMVTGDGVVKLLDFGIAALLEPVAGAPGTGEMTRESGVGLTPEYAAPEQLLGQPVTTATDVYALGLVLFVLLAGRHPAAPEGKSAVELARITLDQDPPRPSRVAANVERGRALRGDLDNIVAKALRREPAERYPTVDAFAQDLGRFLAHEPVSAHADSVAYRTGKFLRRHRGSVAGATVTTVALVVTAAFALLQMREARHQRDAAFEQTRQAEAFNALITSLLSQMGPGGRPLTAEELLDRAVGEVRAQFADDPVARVAMLVRISGRYYDLRRTDKEYAVLVEADEVARRANDPMLIADVQCNTAETEIAAGRPDAAQRRMEEARRLLATLPRPRPGMWSICQRSEAELALSRGDVASGIAHLEEARRALLAEGRTWGNAYPGALSALAAYHSFAGHVVEAHRIHLEIDELDRRYRRRDSLPGLIGRSSLGHSYYTLGLVQQARATFEELSPSVAGPDSPPPLRARVGLRYGAVLSRQGEHERALTMLRDAVGHADLAGNRSLAYQSRLALAGGLLRAGDPDGAEEPLSEALRMMQEIGSGTVGYRADADRLRAEVRLAQGKVDAAAAAVNEGLERLGYPQQATNAFLAPLLEVAARVETARGDEASAREHARLALKLFTRNTTAPEDSLDVADARRLLASLE